jgi:hypothetical protein
MVRCPEQPGRRVGGFVRIAEGDLLVTAGTIGRGFRRKVIFVTDVEVIVAALAAGAGAGSSDAAKAAVMDVYAGLRDALRRRLAGRRDAERALEADETDPEVWQARLGHDLTDSGADRDEHVLAAARHLLRLVDPDGTQVRKYIVDLRGAREPQVGDGSVRIGTNHGPAAGTMTGPVTVTYGQLPVPPAQPEA